MVDLPFEIELGNFAPAEDKADATIGFATVRFPELGFEITNLKLKQENGKTRATLPRRAIIRDGMPERNGRGEMRSVSILRFFRAEDYARFSDAVVALVQREYPRAFISKETVK